MMKAFTAMGDEAKAGIRLFAKVDRNYSWYNVGQHVQRIVRDFCIWNEWCGDWPDTKRIEALKKADCS